MQEPRNPLFTGRETILADMITLFASDHPTIALHGPEGIGKTQIAIEYVYRHQQEYQTVMWFDASSRAILSVGIGVFADQQLHLTDAERMNEPHLFAAFQRWLQQQEHWLLVLDHLEDLSLVEKVVPPQHTPARHILLTTRQQVPEALAHTLTVPNMDIEEGTLFLLRRAGWLPLATEEIERIPRISAQDETSYDTEQEENQPKQVQRISDQINYYEIRPVSEEIAQSIRRLPPRTHALLCLLSFLPSDIPQKLLLEHAAALRKPLHDLEIEQVIDPLLDSSLIFQSDEMIHIAPIVREIVMTSLKEKQRRHWAKQAVRLVNHAFPLVRFDLWSECERYLLVAQYCANLIRDYTLKMREAGLLLERLGNYCFRRVRYAEAETYLTQARDLYEQHLSTQVLGRAQVFNTLGLLYNEQARYTEAEECHLQALELRERKKGPDDPITAQSLHNLALIYSEQGKYQEAERIYLRVLEIEGDDGDSADTLNNLGVTNYHMGRYAEAKDYYQRALTLYEQKKGPEHPDVAIPLIGLGSLAEDQEDYAQAEVLYQRALAIREHALDPNHPDIAHGLNHLADLYESQGRYQQAEEFYQRALSIIEQALSPEHPDVALLFNNLAFLANKQEQYQKAEALYQRALAIYEQALGEQHPYVASVLQNLGRLYHNMKEDERAESLLRRALALRKQQFGPDHPDVALNLDVLGSFLVEQQRDGEAEPLLQRALALYLLVYGPQHPDVARVQEKIALVQKKEGRG